MALFVLRKLILQTRMLSHPVGQVDVWFLFEPFVYFHTLCVWTTKAAGRLCDKYHNLMSWFIWLWDNSSVLFRTLPQYKFLGNLPIEGERIRKDMAKEDKSYVAMATFTYFEYLIWLIRKGYLSHRQTAKGAEKPAHPHSLARAFAVAHTKETHLWPFWVAGHAHMKDLKLHDADLFSHDFDFADDNSLQFQPLVQYYLPGNLPVQGKQPARIH